MDRRRCAARRAYSGSSGSLAVDVSWHRGV